MLVINFNLETANDGCEAMDVANAICKNKMFDLEDLEAISDHIITYVRTKRQRKHRLERETTLEAEYISSQK